MQCVFTMDMAVNPATMAESEKHKIRYRVGKSVALRDVKSQADIDVANSRSQPEPYFPAGTVYESPLAWKFCLNGEALPHDDECRKACGATDAELEQAQHCRRRLEAGIEPKDWPLYDAGVITGYDSDEQPVPGPKWDEYQAALRAAQASEEQEDDE